MNRRINGVTTLTLVQRLAAPLTLTREHNCGAEIAILATSFRRLFDRSFFTEYALLFPMNLGRFLFLCARALLFQECPDGVVQEDAFKDIYAKFFPHGSE